MFVRRVALMTYHNRTMCEYMMFTYITMNNQIILNSILLSILYTRACVLELVTTSQRIRRSNSNVHRACRFGGVLHCNVTLPYNFLRRSNTHRFDDCRKYGIVEMVCLDSNTSDKLHID